MRRLLILLFAPLFLTGCNLTCDVTHIDISPRDNEFAYGEAFHGVFTASEPIVITQIFYKEDGELKDTKYISRTNYENPPYEVDWDGVRLKVHDLSTFEVWIDVDARPTTAENSSFVFDLLSADYEYGDFSNIKTVSDLSILRVVPAEEAPVE